MPPGQVIWFIIGTVAILFGAYYVTYFIGMKASGQTRAGMRNRNIVVRDRFAVSRDKSFYIIEVAGNVYFVGVADHGMTLFDTFSADEFDELTQHDDDGSPQMPWTDTPVGQYGNKLTKAVVAYFAKRREKTAEKDGQTADFAETLKNAAEKGETDTDGNVSESDSEVD